MKTIEHTIDFPAGPQAVYDALMDSAKHAAFTGAPAEITASPGGAFACYGGRIGGYTLDLAEGKRIVQAWRPANFPEGVFTLVTYTLAAEGAGTRLSFTQQAVPDSAYDHLDAGWHDRYWKPLRAYLEKASA